MIVDLPSRASTARGIVRTLRRFRPSKFIDAREIAFYLRPSVGTVRQTASGLVKRGWLESTKGPNGGYRLSAEAREKARWLK